MRHPALYHCILLSLLFLLSHPSAQAQRAKDCPICYGSGKCQTCYGRGGETHYYSNNTFYRECGACGGRGRCSHCNGSGLDPNQSYAADAAQINASANAGRGEGESNPQKHVVEGRNYRYEAVRFSTNDEKNWLYETGSADITPNGWQLMENMVQFGEDSNYWYLRDKDPNSLAPNEVIAVPKNNYGDLLFDSGNGEWSTVAFLSHDYRFININYNGYSYQKTFQGPTWRKLAMPYGGTGVASLVGICEETSEDDNYWYLKDGNSTIKLAKTGNEVGKRTTFSPVTPTAVKDIEAQNEEADEQDDNENAGEQSDSVSGGNASTSSTPVWMWVFIILLVVVTSIMGTYIFMLHRQGQDKKDKKDSTTHPLQK